MERSGTGTRCGAAATKQRPVVTHLEVPIWAGAESVFSNPCESIDKLREALRQLIPAGEQQATMRSPRDRRVF
jgi:hypothetical protein